MSELAKLFERVELLERRITERQLASERRIVAAVAETTGKLSTLLEILAKDDSDDGPVPRDLDGFESGGERQPGQSLG